MRCYWFAAMGYAVFWSVQQVICNSNNNNLNCNFVWKTLSIFSFVEEQDCLILGWFFAFRFMRYFAKPRICVLCHSRKVPFWIIRYWDITVNSHKFVYNVRIPLPEQSAVLPVYGPRILSISQNERLLKTWKKMFFLKKKINKHGLRKDNQSCITLTFY